MGLFDGIARRGSGREIEPNSQGVFPTHVPHVTMDKTGMMQLFKKQFGGGGGTGALNGGWSAAGSSFAGGYRTGPGRLAKLLTAMGGTKDSAAWVFSCVSLIASTGAAYPWRFVGADGQTVDKPPQDLLTLLERPNEVWTYFDMVEAVLTDVELVGNAYLLRDKLNKLNQPGALMRLRPERTTIALNPDGTKRGYVYTLNNGLQIPYEANEVLHFKYPNPMDPHYGMGTVEAIAGLIDRQVAMDQHVTGFFQNGARISGILTVPGNLSDTQFERIKNTYQEQFSGSASAYKMLVAEQATDYKPVTSAPAAAGTVDLMKIAKDEILSAFGIPEFLLGGAHQAGVEKMEEAQNIFLRAMIPKARRISERISIDVAQWWGLTFRMDPHANEPLSVRIGYAKEMIGSGAIVQEAREAQGLPPLTPDHPDFKMANRVLIPSNLIPLDIAGQPPRPATSMPIDQVGEHGSVAPGAPGSAEANLQAHIGDLPAQIAAATGSGKTAELELRLDGIEGMLRKALGIGTKYSDDEERDDHGRWSGSGGGSGADDDSGGSGDLASVVSAAREGGGTINTQDGSQPTTGYAVALQGHSSITPEEDFFGEGDDGVPKGVAITSKWLADNAEVFDDPGMHIGVWHDTENGEVVLDPSEVISDRDEAIQAGVDRNQQAIYDIGGGEEISTGGTGDRDDGKAATHDREAEEEDQRDDAGGARQLRSADRRSGRGEGKGRTRDQLTALGATSALSALLGPGKGKTVTGESPWKPPSLPKGFEPITKATTAAERDVRDVQAECLRYGVDVFTPVFRKFFREQRGRVIDALAQYGDVNKRGARLRGTPTKAKDELGPDKLFDPDAENIKIKLAYMPALDDVTSKALESIPEGTGVDSVGDGQVAALRRMRDTLGEKIVGINETTREAISKTVSEGLRRGYSIPQIANGYPDESYPGIMGVFDQATDVRAETIARTESAFAFNGAQVETYAANDITHVQIMDGTEWDEECAEADGQIWTLEEYKDNPIAHPNCTRAAGPAAAPEDDGGGDGLGPKSPRLTPGRKYSPDQERDDHGRFADEGGGLDASDDTAAQPSGVATAQLLSSVKATGLTGEDAADAFNDKTLPDTKTIFTNDDGELTDSRAALHADILNSIVAGHASQDDPQALFTAGGPASGKSALAGTSDNEDVNLPVPDDAVMIDPDAIKAQLPEYGQLVAAGRADIAAAAVHEESSDIAKTATAYAYEHDQNVVIDGVGNTSPERFTSKLDAANDAGDTVTVRYATVPTEVALDRADQRYQDTGRYVAPDVVEALHANVSNVYNRAVSSDADVNVEVYNTAGATPSLIASKPSGGELTVTDPAAYADFVGKATEGASDAGKAAGEKPGVKTLIEQPFDSATYAFANDATLKYPGPLKIDGVSWSPPKPK